MQTWQDGTCNEKSGFLFKHECYQMPTGTCQTCGKPVCADHAHELPDGTFCTTCARAHIKGPQGPSMRPVADNRSTTGVHDHYYYHNDPYLYGSSYYYGYHYGSSSRRSTSHHDSSAGSSAMSSDAPGNDPKDFTEADGGSFEVEKDEDQVSEFENDMSES